MSKNSMWQAVTNYPRKSVMTSLLWLTALTFPIGAMALMWRPWPGVLIFLIGVISVGFSLRYYSFWSKNDPDRLQTEDYRIQKDFIEKAPELIEISPQHFAPRNTKLIPRVSKDEGNE